MRKTLLTSLLLLFAVALSAQTNTGQTPTVGSSYYIYNVGQKKYLGNDGSGQLTLGGTPFTVTIAEDGNVSESLDFYKLNTAYGKVSSTPFEAPRCDGTGKYDQWKFDKVSGKDNVYYIASRHRELNTNYFLYYSEIFSGVYTEPLKPFSIFSNCQWMLISPSDAAGLEITLDEASTSYTTPDAGTYKVNLKRSFQTSQWNTFCIPFSISADELKAFGTDSNGKSSVGLAEFISADATTLHFKSATSIEAGKPYLIYPTASDTEWTFNNVSSFASAPSNTAVTSTEGLTVTFTGTFTAAKVATGAYVVGSTSSDSNNQLYHLTSEASTKGFRAYFVETSGNASKIALWTIDGITTSIDEIQGLDSTKPFNVYNLNGQMVKTNATTTDGLPKGVYIINGRKMVVR